MGSGVPVAEHHHDHQLAGSLLQTLWLNLGVAVAELVTGSWGRSASLVASGLHAGGDMLISLASWGSARVAARPADGEHPYGFGRVELLAALLVYLSLVGIGWQIVASALRDLVADVPREPPALAAAVVPMVVLVVKELFYRHLRELNKDLKSRLLGATSWHQRADAWSGLPIALTIVTAGLGDWWQLDRYGAVVLGVAMAGAGVYGFATTVMELLDVPPDDDVMARLRAAAGAAEGVVFVKELRARRSGRDVFVQASLAVRADLSVAEAAGIAEGVRRSIRAAVPAVKGIVAEAVPAGVDEGAPCPAPSEAAAEPGPDPEPETAPGPAPALLATPWTSAGHLLAGAAVVAAALGARALVPVEAGAGWAARFVGVGLLVGLVAATTAGAGALAGGTAGARGLARAAGLVALAAVVALPAAGREALGAADAAWGDLRVLGVVLASWPFVALLLATPHGAGLRARALDAALVALGLGLLDRGGGALVLEGAFEGGLPWLGPAHLGALAFAAGMAGVAAVMAATRPGGTAGRAALLSLAVASGAVAAGRVVGLLSAALLLGLSSAAGGRPAGTASDAGWAAGLAALPGILAARVALHVSVPVGAPLAAALALLVAAAGLAAAPRGRPRW